MKKSVWEKIDEINKLQGVEGKWARYTYPFKFFSRYILERLAYFHSSNNFRIMCYRKIGVNIGEDVFIGNYVVFDRIFPNQITIEDHSSIGDYSIISAHANIPMNTPVKKLYPRKVQPVRIGKGVWMMPHIIITPGVTIGDYSVIATGSVLIDDIPPMVMAAGVPAIPKKDIKEKIKPHISEEEYNELMKIRKKMGYKE
jgi:acetyltransferase-like isoleucine patch superfamily enzyme